MDEETVESTEASQDVLRLGDFMHGLLTDPLLDAAWVAQAHLEAIYARSGPH